MRKVMCLVAVALVAGVAASLAASSATATTAPSWYTVSVKLIPGHPLGLEASVENVGTVTHKAVIVLSLKGPKVFGGLPTGLVVTLKPHEHWTGSWTMPAPNATYVAKFTATHLFEPNDPAELLGATASATSTAIVR
jgi:hypothetical protein